MQEDAKKEALKEKIISAIKTVGGTAGVIGSMGVFFAGVVTANPLLMSTWILSIPSLKIANDGVKRDYTSQSLFGISREKSKKFKKDDGEKIEKKVDLVQQKTFSKAPLDVMLISSDKKFKEQIKIEKKEFLAELKKKEVTREEKRNLKKEFKENIDKKKKMYSKFKKDQISTFYNIQMINLFSQLKEKDEFGNKITYYFNSHGVTINALKKMESKDGKGFVENIQTYNSKKKNMIVEKMLLGNINPIKEIGSGIKTGITKGPKAGIKKLKNRLGKKTDVYDITFELTGESVTVDQMKELIGEEALESYSISKTRNGDNILKFDREKFAKKQEEIVRTIVNSNLQQKNAISGNFALSREQHMTESMKNEKQQTQSRSQKLKEELKRYRELIIQASRNKQQMNNISYTPPVEEEENIIGKSL